MGRPAACSPGRVLAQLLLARELAAAASECRRDVPELQHCPGELRLRSGESLNQFQVVTQLEHLDSCPPICERDLLPSHMPGLELARILLCLSSRPAPEPSQQ